VPRGADASDAAQRIPPASAPGPRRPPGSV